MLIRRSYDIGVKGIPPFVASDTMLFTAVKEGASSPFTTKAFQFGRAGDEFTLENAGGTGGDSSISNARFIYAAASPDKQWFAAVHNTSDNPIILIWRNNGDGTMSFHASFNQLSGVPTKLVFSPDSTKLFATGSGGGGAILQYLKLTTGTWASQETMNNTTLGFNSPNSISHHPTEDKLLIANGVVEGTIREVTYTASAFGSSVSIVSGVSNTRYLQPRYSPNGEYVIYGQNAGTVSPYTREIKLHKIGVGLVDTLDVSSVVRDVFGLSVMNDAQWFSNSSHAVFVTTDTATADIAILIKRTGDSLSLEQTIDYSADNPNIANISLTQDTNPLLAIGAGDPRAGTGGWVVSAERKHLRTLKFDSDTGLFDTTPVQDFTEGNVAAFAPSSAYPPA